MDKNLYKYMDWPKIEEIVYAESDNPHALLGLHPILSLSPGGQMLAQAYFPGASSLRLCLEGGREVEMEKVDEAGYFAQLLPGKKPPAYHFEAFYPDGSQETAGDAYGYAPWWDKRDLDKFGYGIHYTVYEKMGAHPREIDGVEGVYFSFWAPNAMRVSVVGDFNRWDGRRHQMRRLGGSGIFELFVPGALVGQRYKYELKLPNGFVYLKADPYANAAQLRPDTASVVADLTKYVWTDGDFLQKRRQSVPEGRPISIYECHLASFCAGEDGPFANYRVLGEKLAAYAKEMAYTHVELMPIMEHPLDASWGYQVTGFYAPTARYGSPEDFMDMVNTLHREGIGVILDWVPAHFPKDVHGLSSLDGTCLYEHPDSRRREHPHWGTLIFDYGRPQVSNFLIANALYWVDKYHVDGIRMDAVASMLYLDYGRDWGAWEPNIYGGKENLEAIEMIKHLNSILKKYHPGVLSIAEESTAFPLITGELDQGGLGFDLKWNMGWMNDFLSYMRLDPYFRSHHHGELTFSMIYQYSERFINSFSHDEAVHGKGSLYGKMPGGPEEKMANLRLALAYRIAHPGKKLLFMGQDLGEEAEWSEERVCGWDLLDLPAHAGLNRMAGDLNRLYISQPALHLLDENPEGFAWINFVAYEQSYLAFVRKSGLQENMLLVAANFSGVDLQCALGAPAPGRYRLLFSTEEEIYGGKGCGPVRELESSPVTADALPDSLDMYMPALSLGIWSYQPYTAEELAQYKKRRRELEREAKKKSARPAKEKGKPRKPAKEKKE